MKTGKLILSFLMCTSLMCADTITVTSLDDSGSGTLREAMTNAVNGDTINFDSMLTGTITLQSSLPAISVEYLIIQGPNDNSITIDGDSTYRIFDVQMGPTIISNLNLNNGADANQGGAIFVGSAVYAIATNLNVTPASGTDGENPIFVDGDGYFDVTDTLFTSASANQIYLNASSMSATSNVPMAFNIDGVGGGVVIKYGSDVLNVTAPNGITSGYYLMVNEGTLVFSGEIDGPGITFTGGELDGTCAMYDASNFGAVMPGDSETIGTMTLSADYFSILGIDKIKIEPNGACDVIETVSGDVYLYESVLTILPESGTYTQGTKFTFMTTNGGVNGTYDSVSVDGLDVQINYNLQSIEIEILNTATI
jgi:hypothetical protein